MAQGTLPTGDRVEQAAAFLAGIILVDFLIVAGDYLAGGSQLNGDIGRVKIAFVAIFIGLSTGYYLGASSVDKKGLTAIFIVGILLSLVVLIVYSQRLSPITWMLGSSGILVYLLFFAGLIEQNREFEKWVNRAKTTSIIGLILIGSIQYGIPEILGFSTWLSSKINQIDTVVSDMSDSTLFIVVAIFGIVLVFVLAALLIENE
jgi:fructose-specific phosphotransferase system IIC component